MKLWEIGSELDAIGMLITDQDGVIDDAIEERLDMMKGEFTEKVTRMALLVRQFEADAEAASSEELRLKAIRKAHEASAKRLKEYIQHCMEAFDQPFIRSPRARIRIQRNTQPIVRVTVDVDELPNAYTKTTRTVDKSAVLREWERSAPDVDDRHNPEGFEITWGSHLRIY